MPKRRNYDLDREYDKINRKVRKLQEKLERYDREYSNRGQDYSDSPSPEHYPGFEEEGNEQSEEDNFNTEGNTNTKENTNTENNENNATSAVQDSAEESDSLDPEILKILGDDPLEQKVFGENFHKDIANRWNHILTNGIPKDIKTDLLKIYLPAENCPNMKAPKLNMEIKAALNDLAIKKDAYAQSKQNQLSGCLAAIGKALNIVLTSKETVPQSQELIKALSDAGRLIGDCHHRESMSRRFGIINTLNKDTRDTVRSTKIDEYLFGCNLGDHLKSAKAIWKSGSEMKSTVQRAPFKQFSSTRGALNSRGSSRGAPRANPTPRRLAAGQQREQPPPRDYRDSRRDPTSSRHQTNSSRHQRGRRR